jgi:hypothetical protein
MRPRVGECRGGLARGKTARLRAVQGPAGSAAASNDSLVRIVLRPPDSPCPRPGKRGPWQRLRALRRGSWARYERTQHAPATAASADTAAPAASRLEGERSPWSSAAMAPRNDLRDAPTDTGIPEAANLAQVTEELVVGEVSWPVRSKLARLSKYARATVRPAAPRLQVQPRRAMNGMALR